MFVWLAGFRVFFPLCFWDLGYLLVWFCCSFCLSVGEKKKKHYGVRKSQ